MTNTEAKLLCLRALKNSFSDDLERAQLAFRGLSPERMAEEYGQSGRTRQQILDEYQIDRDSRTAALAWLESVTP